MLCRQNVFINRFKKDIHCHNNTFSVLHFFFFSKIKHVFFGVKFSKTYKCPLTKVMFCGF